MGHINRLSGLYDSHKRPLGMLHYWLSLYCSVWLGSHLRQPSLPHLWLCLLSHLRSHQVCETAGGSLLLEPHFKGAWLLRCRTCNSCFHFQDVTVAAQGLHTLSSEQMLWNWDVGHTVTVFFFKGIIFRLASQKFVQFMFFQFSQTCLLDWFVLLFFFSYPHPARLQSGLLKKTF